MKSYFPKQSIFLVALMITSAFTIFTSSSCKKEDLENSETNDSYYVKYVIIGNGTYGRFSNWTVTAPQGLYTNNGYQTRSWSQTYGPVTKGFKCEVKIGDYIGGAPTIEIHVAKNAEPFALKISKTGSSALYNVNF
jgi:hypothetical protein